MRRLDDGQALEAMSRALGSPFGVSGAATLHAGMGREFSRTFLRIEGFEESVAYRSEKLMALLAEFGAEHALQGEDSRKLWRSIRDVEFLAEPRERAVWRISVKPSSGPDALARLGALAQASMLDWGGGLVWIATDPTAAAAEAVRRALARTRRPRDADARAGANSRQRRRVRTADADVAAPDPGREGEPRSEGTFQCGADVCRDLTRRRHARHGFAGPLTLERAGRTRG